MLGCRMDFEVSHHADQTGQTSRVSEEGRRAVEALFGAGGSQRHRGGNHQTSNEPALTPRG
jgi:sigma54-dependent transcription regulator